MQDLANELGLGFQMARRVDIWSKQLVPALVHWEAGHFAVFSIHAKGSSLRNLRSVGSLYRALWQ
jgi:hypothetical protein